jgi:hypothetical protein
MMLMLLLVLVPRERNVTPAAADIITTGGAG